MWCHIVKVWVVVCYIRFNRENLRFSTWRWLRVIFTQSYENIFFATYRKQRCACVDVGEMLLFYIAVLINLVPDESCSRQIWASKGSYARIFTGAVCGSHLHFQWRCGSGIWQRGVQSSRSAMPCRAQRWRHDVQSLKRDKTNTFSVYQVILPVYCVIMLYLDQPFMPAYIVGSCFLIVLNSVQNLIITFVILTLNLLWININWRISIRRTNQKTRK